MIFDTVPTGTGKRQKFLRGNRVDSIAVPLFTIRNKNPKNSDCEMSWLVYKRQER